MKLYLLPIALAIFFCDRSPLQGETARQSPIWEPEPELRRAAFAHALTATSAGPILVVHTGNVFTSGLGSHICLHLLNTYWRSHRELGSELANNYLTLVKH